MNSLYPKTPLDEIGNIGEREVAQALLKQCPDDWRILWSKHWLINRFRYDTNPAREGEIDFVVLIPGKGFVCLEVKGGRNYRIEPRTGRFQRLERPDRGDKYWADNKKTPWKQVSDNKHALVKILKAKLPRGNLGCAYEAAVVFPRAGLKGALPAGEDSSLLVIDQSRMSDLYGILLECINQRPRSHGDTSAVEKLLFKSDAAFVRTLSMDIEDQGRKLLELTNSQSRALRGAISNKQLLVSGGPGTGKTVLALELATRLARSGQRVLYVCFSRKLASWVEKTMALDSLVVSNFHRLAKQYIERAGLSLPDDLFANGADEELSNTFLEAISHLGRHVQFDSIVIDEAQDINENWFVPLLELWNNSGHFFQFGDQNQVLFSGALSSHPKVPVYELYENCRSTRFIARACDRILETAKMPVVDSGLDALPLGDPPRWYNLSDAGERRQKVFEIIGEWRNEGLAMNQIAVLVPSTQYGSLAVHEKDQVLSGIPFTCDIDIWRSSGGVLVETIKAFKGLEADGVILLDIPVPDESPSFSWQDAYVAFSRAKHLLVAIAKSGPAASMLSKWFQV